MKLGKTAEMLVRKAAESRLGRVYTTRAHGRGCRGLEGGRAGDAACKLRDAGYLRFIAHEHSRDVNAGYATHYTTAVWELTDKGRELLAQLTTNEGKK